MPSEYFNPRAPCGARPFMQSPGLSEGNFNPRAPCGARPFLKLSDDEKKHFNPRAPCGARRVFEAFKHAPWIFQSTGSVWSPTLWCSRAFGSIQYFNPRAPCGARRSSGVSFLNNSIFQSTGSVWSPTQTAEFISKYFIISIHGLRVEPDG